MTDRHAGYLVVLERDIREDDAVAIVGALRMLKGVSDVQPVETDGGLMQSIADTRVRAELRRVIAPILWPTWAT